MVRVLVVEDEEIAAAAHAEYVRRIDGFELAAVARSGSEALRLLRDAPAGSIDVILLDMNLPDLHGLDVARQIRAAGIAVDIIAVTAVRELDMVRNALSLGMVQYLIKPFTFPALVDKLQHYLRFRESFVAQESHATQADVDHALGALRTPLPTNLPKGLSPETLQTVTRMLRGSVVAYSAAEVAESLAIARVTARRYLDHLADQGQVLRSPRYGGQGRPELEYRWRS